VTNAQGTFTVLQGTNIVSDATVLGGFFANATFIDTEYFGIFGQGEFEVTDRIRLIAGIRYNDEKKFARCGGSNFTGDTNGDGTVDRVVNVLPGIAGSSPVTLPANANDLFSYNCNASDEVTTATTGGSSGSFSNVTWRAGAEFDLNDDVMLYANSATGYLSGSASTTTTTDEQESQVIEVGFRSRLGIGNLKGLFERLGKYQRPHCGFNPQTSLSEMRAFILRGGLTDLFSQDRVSMALHCGVWVGKMGKEDLSAPGTESESGWGMRRFARMRRGGPELLVGRGWASRGGSESCRSRRALQWRRGCLRDRHTVDRR